MMLSSTPTLEDQVSDIASRGRSAALRIASAPTAAKNRFLAELKARIADQQQRILDANQQDCGAARSAGLAEPMLNRLQLSPQCVASMFTSIDAVTELPDPVGRCLDIYERPNALSIEKQSCPMGLLGVIYEARPTVTVDCAALCVKSGNAVILKGGREAFQTNGVLVELIQDALKTAQLPEDAVQMIPSVDRDSVKHLIKLKKWVNCIIPRGGKGLIDYVTRESLVPVIKSDLGVCNLYVDAATDPQKALDILLNSKVQRPELGNAVENLFLHKSVLVELLPSLAEALHREGVRLKVDDVCEAVLLAAPTELPFELAQEEDFYTEFLDKTLSIRSVSSLQDAIRCVNEYGSGFSDAIVTESEAAGEEFLRSVDSAAVYWNASTRLTDGAEFGFGAEIGVSTDRLHARGPIGLNDLCTYKYLLRGNGQIRL